MATSPDNDPLAGRLRTMQIIAAAILSGAVGFLVIAVFLRQGGAGAGAANTPLITYIILALAVVNIILSLVVPDMSAAAARRKIAQGAWMPAQAMPPDDAGQLSIVYTTRLLIGLAMLEGATFALLIAYLVEGQAVSLIVAVLLIGAMAWRFPTRARLTAWIEEQERLLANERLGGA
jgi:hypothetical protein